MKLRIEISAQWMQKQKNNGVMPVSEIVSHLQSQFGQDLVCEEKSFSIVDLSFDENVVSKDKLIDALKRFMRKEFGVIAFNSVVTVTDKSQKTPSVDEDSKGKAACDNPVSSEMPEIEDEESFDDGFAKDGVAFDDDSDDSFGDQPFTKTSGSASSTGDKLKRFDESYDASDDGSLSKGGGGSTSGGGVDSLLAKVDSLIGAEQFKKLCHELNAIAPLVKQNGAIECIANQIYLFSINDGYGLTTALSLFSGVLGATELRNMDASSFIEIKIAYKPDGDKDPFESYRPGLDKLIGELSSRKQHATICFDISEWMTNINNKSLREFMRQYYKSASQLTLVYRIPCVNEEIFNRVQDSLSDIAFVRGVQFPTLSQEQLRACAKEYLNKYGFALADDAWIHFDEKIFQEKKDGRFYGFSTVSKVVNELLYKKHVHCIINDNTEKVISAPEVDAICSHVLEAEVGMETLNEMVGGDKIKARLEEIIAQIEIARMTGGVTPCIHMRFIGNPGTGKTTVARIIGKVLKEKGVLRLGGFYEYSGRDFCGRYIGETAPKTAAMCRDAYGSILFIDEAYSLYRGDDDGKDYGREALDTLIAEMENNRSDLLVIMAGYPHEMEKLMEGNQGLASRMPYVLEFPNFNRDEMIIIFKKMIKAPYVAGEGLMEKVEEYFKAIPQSFLDSKQFSNARFVRNLFERTLAKTAMRKREAGAKDIVIAKEDFELASTDKEFRNFESKTRKIGFR